MRNGFSITPLLLESRYLLDQFLGHLNSVFFRPSLRSPQESQTQNKNEKKSLRQSHAISPAIVPLYGSVGRKTNSCLVRDRTSSSHPAQIAAE